MKREKFVRMKLNFKELFILEHALRTHINRECATDKDIVEENQLLDRVNNNIRCIK